MQPSRTNTLLAIGLTVLITACGSDGGSENTGNTGTAQSSAPTQALGSHNAGQNCMSGGCHDGTSNAATFTVGGTLYKSDGSAQTAGTVRLYVHNTNTLAAQLTTDASGNFYSTATVEGLFVESGGLVSGVDVEVEGPNGTHNMPGLITSGACSGCHGQSNAKVVAN